MLDPRVLMRRQAKEERDPYRLGTLPNNLPPVGAHGSYFRSAPFPMPDLLTLTDIAGMCQISLLAARRLCINRVPDYAIVRMGKNEMRVHSWAIARLLKMTAQCPGCNRKWEE